MKESLQPGLIHEVKLTVTPQMCIEWVGETPVFSTPSMIWQMEEAGRQAALPHLDEGEETVGTAINIRHLAATPVGMQVTVRARLIEVDRRRLVFEVEAFDEKEKIGEGTIERFVIDVGRFAERVKEKKARGEPVSSCSQ